MLDNKTFYDGFGDKMAIKEDCNPYILSVSIVEDSDDNGVSNKASFILSKEDALELADLILKKFKDSP